MRRPWHDYSGKYPLQVFPSFFCSVTQVSISDTFRGQRVEQKELKALKPLIPLEGREASFASNKGRMHFDSGLRVSTHIKQAE